MGLFAKKPLDALLQEARDTSDQSLKRTLGPTNLVLLGIGAIIGAGLFVRTAAAIADRSGPSVVLAFMVAGIGCAFAGLCYAEFASMIAGIIAQHPERILEAVIAAVYLHGLAGDIACYGREYGLDRGLGEQCLVATDLIRSMPNCLTPCASGAGKRYGL